MKYDFDADETIRRGVDFIFDETYSLEFEQ